MADKDLLENLFESMDLLISSRMQDLNYDKTELCTIEEVKGNKEYYVSNGAAKYVAYAQGDAEYKQGSSVYVTIPQGNYNNQKLIIGKYTLDRNNPLNWVSPMENFVDITGNIINSIPKKGLIANGAKYDLLLWEEADKNKVYTQYDRLCISADFSNSLIEHMVIDGHYGLILVGKKSNTELDIEIAKALDKIDELEKNKEITENKAKELRQEVENRKYFELFFDCSDMIGDPYSFTVPYKQEMLFELLPTDKISELQLYFYQSGMEQGKVTKTFYGIDNELIQQDQTENLFVENVSVHFGYSFDVYDDETAILYTLDSLIFEKNKDNSEIKPVKELQLRWVHHEDEQSYSITDIVHSSLKNHYVQVHWYRYDLQSDPNDKDPLAGYFWKEITDNINRFSLKTDLNPLWTKEKFKVVIEYDGRVIHSNILEFTNPSGEVGTSSMITGLTINYPERDEYNGTFYIYGDDHFAGFSTERLFYLIADYVTLDGDNEYWENSDVICWKFPKINTMIHKPENGFEYDEENGDVFLEAGTSSTATVNGIVFTADSEYHQVIRRIVISTEKDGSNRNSEESRTQGYRIFNQYIGTAIDNTIKCQVFKPTMNSIEAKISFTFGLHTTNGTKYTLAVDWTEIAHVLDNNGNQQTIEYQRPPAITMHETYRWIFNVKILDSDQREIEAPEGGWPIKIGWHDNRIANPKESGDTISKIITYDSANKRITVNISKDDYNNYINFAQYQILKISIDTSKCDFDYALTTFIPLPIRARRDIVAIEGADRIYYDASGYNPKWNKREYQLLFKPGKDIDNITWGLKTTQDDYIKEDISKRGHLWTQMPRLDTNDTDGIVKRYLAAPEVYLPPAGNPYNGICVYAKNGDTVLWVQPIYVTMDPYGSKYLNEWDGSLVIDEEKGVVMSSVIGAGKKNEDNTFSGVILGKVDGVLDSSQNSLKETKAETGIVGLHHGIPSFGFRDDGTAFLGKKGSGQIQFDGSKGYIMSSNFDGFGKNEDETGKLPDLDENGLEKKWNDLIEKKADIHGTYIGLSSGRAWFGGDVGISGTIYSSEGNIGGWIINSNDLSKSMRQDGVDVYTILRAPDTGNGDTTAIAVGAKGKDATNVANAPFKVSYGGKLTATGADISGIIKIENGDVGDWTVDEDGLNNGNNPTIYLSAEGIGKTNLKVNDNAPTDKSNGWTIYANGNFGVDTKGNLFANNATVEGTIKATSGEIGGCKITKEGNLEVPAANITGTLTADKIDVANIKIDAAQITSGTIASARIGDATITSAKIKSLAVSKINGGTNSNDITFSGNINCTGDITCSNLLATGGSIEGTTFKLKKSTSTTASKIQIIGGGAIYADGSGNFTATARINCNNGLFATWIESSGNITIGSTALSEANLKKLLALVS